MAKQYKETLQEGKVQHHGKFAFLLSETPDQEDLMLRGPSLRLAMDGDRVQVRQTPGDKGKRPVGEILQVIERARTSVTGVLRKLGERWIAVPEEADERDAIIVLGFADGISPRPGEVVVVTITQWPSLKEAAGGEVREALGLPTEPGVRLRAVLRTRDLPDTFPDPVLKESRAFPETVSPEMWQGRLDLRGLPIVTIDGADAKDFDDAVSLEILGPGRLRLGVHIADVSHYVKKGTALDDEAAQRATSVYLADRVVPMLPPNLSDGLCSLMPNVERLAVSCFMDLDENGTVLSSSLKESVIRSRRRFTYEEVESVLKGETVANVDAEVQAAVLSMGKLFKALTLARMQRGALELSMPEYKVSVDAEGRPLAVVRRPRLDSHRLIEEFMLLANETVASSLLDKNLPFLSRIHPNPEVRKLTILAVELKKLGMAPPSFLTTNPTKAMQAILHTALGQPLEETINMLVMRSLKQASYSNVPGGHFGLASKAYCHFTSPIRRYPDLVTHRGVKALIHGQAAEAEESAKLKELGAHCSERERVAADAERRSIDILRAELLKKKVGQIFEGVVSGTAVFGLFITLKDLGASGLVRHANAALGSRVQVKLVGVNEGQGELDLAMAGPVTAAPAPAYTQKPLFDSRKPRFDPKGKSRYSADRPKYDPNKPKYSSDKPKFASDRPKWSSDRPKFSSDRPKYDPNKPKYSSDKPKYNSDRPKFGADRPKFDPSKPKYDPNRPKYNSDRPKFSSDRPKYDPSKPKYDPNRPKPDGAKPRFDTSTSKGRWAQRNFEAGKAKPAYDPNRPKFDPNRPKYDPNKKRFDPSKGRSEGRKFDARSPKPNAGESKADPNAKPKFYERFLNKKAKRG